MVKAYKWNDDFVAATVTLPAQGKTLRLRDEDGRPLWRGGPGRGQVRVIRIESLVLVRMRSMRTAAWSIVDGRTGRSLARSSESAGAGRTASPGRESR